MLNLPKNGVVLSLFDRLTDREPRSKYDIASSSWEQIQEAKHAIGRDLASLLNTRHSEWDIPDEFEATNRSIAAYGIQDFASRPTDREYIRRAIEKCIRTFEPRLSHVNVMVEETQDLRLDFRISGFLTIDIPGQAVVFDAFLQKHSSRFHVSEGR